MGVILCVAVKGLKVSNHIIQIPYYVLYISIMVTQIKLPFYVLYVSLVR